ncbi:MAG: hypothetical protein V1760_00220, partial [Candidatus Peregrinibacteria bacterium]
MEDVGIPFETGFKLNLQHEEVQFFFRKHWTLFLRILAFWLFVGILVFIVMLGFYGVVEGFSVQVLRPFFVFIATLIVFFYFNLFFLAVISFYFDMVIITDSRIIVTR